MRRVLATALLFAALGAAAPAYAASTTAPARAVPQPPIPSGMVAGLGAVLAIAVTGMGWALTRRSIERHGPIGRTTVDDLLDAGRRMTASTDHAAVVTTAVTDAVAMTASSAGAFVVRAADGTATVDAPHPLMPADLLRGPIVRALEMGQTARSYRPGRALLVVPVVHDGMVLGALAVVRPTPFTTVEPGVLERLAPLVARALDAAVQHDRGAETAHVDALTTIGNRRRFERDLDDLASDAQVAG